MTSIEVQLEFTFWIETQQWVRKTLYWEESHEGPKIDQTIDQKAVKNEVPHKKLIFKVKEDDNRIALLASWSDRIVVKKNWK